MKRLLVTLLAASVVAVGLSAERVDYPFGVSSAFGSNVIDAFNPFVAPVGCTPGTQIDATLALTTTRPTSAYTQIIATDVDCANQVTVRYATGRGYHTVRFVGVTSGTTYADASLSNTGGVANFVNLPITLSGPVGDESVRLYLDEADNTLIMSWVMFQIN